MIKNYIGVFGQKIVPSVDWLPPIYYPSENGWIATIQESFTPENEGDPVYNVLSILSEQEFQKRFGKRRIMAEFRNVVNFWREYGLDSQEQASAYMHEVICAYAAHRLPEWEKMYVALTTEYNPLENYDRIEDTTETLAKEGEENNEKTGSESNEKTGSESSEKTGSEANEKTGSETTTPTGSETVTTQQNYNGFNSSDSVPVQDSESTTSFDQRSDTLSFTNRKDTLSFTNRKDTLSFTNRKDTLSFTDRKDTLSFKDRVDTRTIDGHIHGNIGVTTSQQMLQSELDLRLYDLAEVIYKEIASHFLLSVY